MRRLAAALALSALLLAGSAAAAPNAANQARLDRTVRFLQEAQQSNGGFGGAGEPSQISSAWTAIALAAAGINPQDQARPAGVDAFTYLASHFWQGVAESDCAPIVCTTTFERELMVVNAAGTSPHDFGGVDLMAGLLARALPDGSFPHVPEGQPGVNDTIFAIFALSPIAEPSAQAPIQHAADWVESTQLGNGGWSWRFGSTRDEVDMTGAAIQALIAAGRGRNEAVEAGLRYLRAAQNPDGGFPEFSGNPESNVASTAWATQAIWAAGENPEDWLTGSAEATEEPLDYMESLQEPDGHIRWKRSQDLNGVWMTAYVAPAFAGQAWPPPYVPPALKPPAAVAVQSGGEGEGVQAGAGTIAGGGGKGAPLFSRPQPQSRGRTPGGARVVGGAGLSATNHSDSRRGDNREQPSGLSRREASAGNAAAPPAHVSEAAADAGSDGEGDGSAGSPAARALASQGGRAGDGEGEVAGLLVGTGAGKSAFGAPGLHGSGAAEESPPPALGIGLAAVLIGLLGARLERRRLAPMAGVSL